MTDLAPILERLGLEQYLDAFVGEGFESWEILTDIQESDFDALNVKLGHRRKLQRAIAEYRGISYERLVGSPAQEPLADSGKAAESSTTPSLSTERASGPPPETKRKYRRHPKPDENAPERPPSAYVIFSNKVREEVKDQNLSFTQIAKLVGDRWQKLDPAGKEPYESQANAAKERYNIQLSTYRKTEAYKEYMQYLADFKSKHGQTAEPKKPRLEAESSGSVISVRSLETNPEMVSQLSGHARAGSIGSVASSPFTGGSMHPTPGTSMSSRPPLASSHSGTPPPVQQGRDYFRPGLPSRHSSVSDESSTVRSDLPEPLARTAALSLLAPSSSGTPPLQSQAPSTAAIDPLGSPDPPPRSRALYAVQHQQQQQQQQQHQQSPSQYPHQPSGFPVVPSISSAQSAPALPFPSTVSSPTTQERPWGSRPSDIRGYPDSPATAHPSLPYGPAGMHQPSASHYPPLFPPDRVSEYQQGPYLRTLPPPRSRSTGTPALGESGSPLLPNPLRFRRPAQEEIPSVFGRSESDAANTLAGLAGTPVSRPDTTKPPI